MSRVIAAAELQIALRRQSTHGNVEIRDSYILYIANNDIRQAHSEHVGPAIEYQSSPFGVNQS